MAIQYSGGPNVQADFFGDTVANLKAGINTQMIAAGWSSAVSGSGFLLTSGTTPQGLACKCNLQDNGSQVTMQFQNTAGTQLGYTHRLPVAANKRFRVIANPFQVFVFVPLVSQDGSGATMGGVPWVPAFLTSGTTTAFWSLGDDSGDTFRNEFVPNSASSTYVLNVNTQTGGGLGSVRLIGVQSSVTNLGLAGSWFNNSALIVEPMLAWGTNSSAAPVIVGELWDAVLVMQSFPLDLATTFDTHNWTNFTDNSLTGSLYLVTP